MIGRKLLAGLLAVATLVASAQAQVFAPGRSPTFRPGFQFLSTAATYLGQVATSTRIPNAITTTTGYSRITRKAHYARDNITANARSVFPCWWVQTANSTQVGQELSSGNAFNINEWIEYPVSTYTQVTFSGSTTGTCQTNTPLLTSDAQGVTIPKGAEFYTWTQEAATGGFIPYLKGANTVLATGAGEKSIQSTTGALLTPATATAADNTSFLYDYGPAAIVDQTLLVSFDLLGDSRTAGVNDAADTSLDIGNLARSIGSSYAYINLGLSGDWPEAFAYSHAMRLALAQYASNVIDEGGINSFYSHGATAAAPVLVYKQRVRNLFAGKPYARSTLEPYTTSSDSWATSANQTLPAWSAARISLISTIKTDAVYADVDAAVDDGTGKWIVNGSANYCTKDGLHDSPACSLLVAQGGGINGASLASAPVATFSQPVLDLTATSPTYNAAGLSGGYGSNFGVQPGVLPYYIDARFTATSLPATAGYIFGSNSGSLLLNTSGQLVLREANGTSVILTAVGGGTQTSLVGTGEHFVRLRLGSDGGISVFLDGSLMQTIAYSWAALTLSPVAYPFTIRNSSLTTAYPFTGSVREVAIVEGDPGTATFTPPTGYTGTEAGLVAVYHLLTNANATLGPAS